MYATVKDMLDRFGLKEVISLTDREYEAEVNEAVALNALEDATAEIDSYLVKFTKPFDSVPRVIEMYCCDIARYRLTGTDVLEDSVIAQRYAKAIDFLEKVASGKLSLGGLPDGQEAKTEDVVMFSEKQKVFGRDNPY
ncbi:gp436 family protein [Neisseria sp. Ec49-e6-T10]|uniref:gp436 family protein n=1 Tax=Neisseria sp. Ec49-e6-T10 TaxID=3140744 RepID=UPI003EBB8FF3